MFVALGHRHRIEHVGQAKIKNYVKSSVNSGFICTRSSGQDGTKTFGHW